MIVNPTLLAAAYRRHKARAAKDGQRLDYDVEQLRSLIEMIDDCSYCRMPLLPGTWQIDHRMPLARDATGHCWSNLRVVCASCNQAKGQMSMEEFLRLRLLLNSFHPLANADVLRRLHAGGRRYRR